VDSTTLRTGLKAPSAALALPILALTCLVCLAPFLGKAVHLDDPLFIWTAQQIQHHPLDFFGFTVNWYGRSSPMYAVMQNPPLACYYLAAAGSLLGWSEPALHLALLAPAFAVLWGTYRLAERLTGRPLLAGLATLWSPVFLVSASGLMCDMLMLAFWVWTLVLWERGLRERRQGLLYRAAGLAGLAALTKYFGLCLIPLLAAYAVASRAGWRRWLGPLTVTSLIIAAYETLTWGLYGRGLVLQAIVYAVNLQHETAQPLGPQLETLLAFLGGCCGGLLFFLPWLWGLRGLLLLTILTGLAVLAAWSSRLFIYSLPENRSLLTVQFGLFAAAGLTAVGLALTDVWRRRDAGSWLLFLWVGGTAVFAGFLNWTLAARSILPLMPALAVLLGRALDHRYRDRAPLLPTGWALAPAAAVSLLVTWADAIQANSVRQAAATLAVDFVGNGSTCWFEGHWGFQYYFEQQGGQCWDDSASHGRPGDWMIPPLNNTNLEPKLPAEAIARTETREAALCPWLATAKVEAGASFYSSQFGPLPYAFAAVPPDRYVIVRLAIPLGPMRVPPQKPGIRIDHAKGSGVFFRPRPTT
jgi:4-amino-4-deoxy-L-arabinose transferase-like glycosyltransferase